MGINVTLGSDVTLRVVHHISILADYSLYGKLCKISP